MRKLVWFAVGFTSAAVVAVYLLRWQWLLLFGAVFLFAGLLSFVAKGKRIRIIRVVLIGLAVSFLWMWLFDTVYLCDLRKLDQEQQELSVTASQFSVPVEYGTTVEGTVRVNGKTCRIRLYTYEELSVAPGDTVQGLFDIRFTGGCEQEDISYSGNGIFLVGNLREGSVIEADKIPVRYYPALWRQKILNLMKQMLPDDVLPFAQALLLGEKSDLDYNTNTDLAVSGIRHVVAVSGLHVSILCGLLISSVGYRRVFTPLVGTVILILFAAVTGFTPSVVRSCLMYLLLFGSMMASRDYDAPTALAFAVLVMLALNPLAITSVGLQLSVGCVIGILLFAKSIRKFLLQRSFLGKAAPKTRMGKICRWIADSVGVTLSTMITTTPLCAAYFGTVSIFGILTNLLTLWVITLIFCGLLCAIIAGAIWLPAGEFLCWIIAWTIRYVLKVAGVVSSVPVAAVYTQSPYVILWIIFVYILLAVFFLGKKKHPWLMTICAVLSLCCAIGFSWLEPRLDDYRVTVMDVGQGQCILLQNKDRHYLVDCGGTGADTVADIAAKTLLSQGITRLDGVILSHYDKDHTAGIENLLTRIDVDMFYLPDENASIEMWSHLLEEEGKLYTIESDSVVVIPGSGITVFAGEENTHDNEHSLCILFQPENCDILITGDRGIKGERALLEQTTLPQVDVLVVGHHGAKDAASFELLRTVRPETAVISVGASNPYGHPAEEVLERLELFGCNILRTDQNGTIVIRG